MRNIVLALLTVLLLNSCTQEETSTRVTRVGGLVTTFNIKHFHRKENSFVKDTDYVITCTEDWRVIKVIVKKLAVPVIDTLSFTRDAQTHLIVSVLSNYQGTLLFSYNTDSTIRTVSLYGSTMEVTYDDRKNIVRCMPEKEDKNLIAYLNEVRFFLNEARTQKEISERSPGPRGTPTIK